MHFLKDIMGTATIFEYKLLSILGFYECMLLKFSLINAC